MENHKQSVLVVNDQEAVCQVWQRIINATKDLHCPVYALDGPSAMTLARSIRPNVILMDMMMPEMYGDEASRHILQEMPDVCIIAYSAYTGTEAAALASGAREYLLMPISPDRLLETIRRVLRS